MEWPKLKNIIILILLLLNGFLLVLVGMRYTESVQYERAALEQTLKVLEGQGIQADGAALAPAGELAPRSYCEGMTISGRAGGELSAALADGPEQRTSDPGRHAAALLRDMGIRAEQTGVTQEDGWTRVRFRQSWDGVPLFSCEAQFAYRDGRLQTVQGTLLAAQGGEKEDGGVMALPTALMRFSEEIAATGDVCSAIQSMEPGWRGTVQPLSGGVRLSPAWLVTTDTAQYYLDCATGALTRITDQ